METQVKSECRCEKASCGCPGAEARPCTCGDKCNCARACRCGKGCNCAAK